MKAVVQTCTGPEGAGYGREELRTGNVSRLIALAVQRQDWGQDSTSHCPHKEDTDLGGPFSVRDEGSQLWVRKGRHARAK